MGALDRAAERIAAVCARPADLVQLWGAATEVLRTAVPHYWSPCWYTLDPASLLVTSHYNDTMHEFPAEWLAAEYAVEDAHELSRVARSQRGMSTLHEVYGGDPSGSPRWRQNMELGGDQELILALRTDDGDVWGALGLYRAPGRPLFDAVEQRFLRAVAPRLAEAARRALLLGEATDPEGPDAPGLVVLNARYEVESTTPGVARLLAALPDGDVESGRLPSAVLSVAARARDGAAGPAEVATARVVTRDRTWVVLRGAAMGSGAAAGQVAVIVEPATPARILPLLMAAHGLTPRERDVVRLVLQGAATSRIAGELRIAPQTVQQHLKSVFDKTGVRSRRDLVARVFFAHYEPRFRDNEARAGAGRPLRGGPAARAAQLRSGRP